MTDLKKSGFASHKKKVSREVIETEWANLLKETIFTRLTRKWHITLLNNIQLGWDMRNRERIKIWKYRTKTQKMTEAIVKNRLIKSATTKKAPYQTKWSQSKETFNP